MSCPAWMFSCERSRVFWTGLLEDALGKMRELLTHSNWELGQRLDLQMQDGILKELMKSQAAPVCQACPHCNAGECPAW